MMTTRTTLLPIVALLVLSLCFYSCAPTLTPRDRAASIGYETSNIYFAMKAKYLEKLNDPALTEDQKVALSKRVVPLLNRLKALNIQYLRLIAEWDKTSVQPDQLSPVQSEMDQVIVTIFDVLSRTQTKKED